MKPKEAHQEKLPQYKTTKSKMCFFAGKGHRPPHRANLLDAQIVPNNETLVFSLL